MRRRDFVDAFVELDLGLSRGEWMASIDWDAAVGALDAMRLPCSGGEEQLLRIAASIAAGLPVDLGAAVTGLDESNLSRVATAIWHAGGRRPVGSSRDGVR